MPVPDSAIGMLIADGFHAGGLEQPRSTVMSRYPDDIPGVTPEMIEAGVAQISRFEPIDAWEGAIARSIAEVENDPAAARGSHVREQATLVVEDAARRRCVHVRDDVAPLKQRENGAHWRN